MIGGGYEAFEVDYECFCSLDKVITGEKNVMEKCIDILEMNASQFKQIVMIAQGEFLELLLAKPKDRASIFRHIFDTAIYKNISD